MKVFLTRATLFALVALLANACGLGKAQAQTPTPTVHLPIVIRQASGHTWTYTEGAKCTVTTRDSVQVLYSDDDAWCDYRVTPGQVFTLTVVEVEPNGFTWDWGITCNAVEHAEEYGSSSDQCK